MRITIYELLGLIKADKAPKTIKYDDYIWALIKQHNEYHNGLSYLITNGVDEWGNLKDFLNEEVEIIEDKPKKIEGIKIAKDKDEYFIETINELTKAVNYLLDKEK